MGSQHGLFIHTYTAETEPGLAKTCGKIIRTTIYRTHTAEIQTLQAKTGEKATMTNMNRTWITEIHHLLAKGKYLINVTFLSIQT